jgi:xanthine/uracil/vitamin C permease (AzgA family)
VGSELCSSGALKRSGTCHGIHSVHIASDLRKGTDVRTEFIAGVTTFLTMVYIVFVNPIILGKTGMDQDAVFVATCVAAAVSTLVMALYANYPIALAPGMFCHFGTAQTLSLSNRCKDPLRR